MKSFSLGVMVGIAITVCGYKPYQIEMEYRHNVVAGLSAQTPVHCITGVDLLAQAAQSVLGQ